MITKQKFQLVLETNVEDIYKPGSELDMPKRPSWNYEMTTEQLNRKEQSYFSEYCKNIMSTVGEEISYFEMNLETWRQLWRVLEMSDILLLITDIRHPVSFYFYY